MALLRSAAPRGAHWAMRGVTLSTLLLLLLLPSLSSQTVEPTANEVKAVFLFNFAQFVDWPDTAFADPASPLIIGILGEDPFGPYLDETVRGETVRGRPFLVRRFQQIEDVTNCHILFVSRSEADRLETILGTLKGRPILTVSDAPEFLRRGGMVGFAFGRSRVRVRIDPDVAAAAGLTISSKLLGAVEIVTPGNP